LSGEDIAVIGHFDFGDLQYLIDKNAASEEEKIEAYRHAVNQIDDEVESLVKLLVSEEKTPIVIGGGHNNAYPLLKGAAKGLHATQQIPLPQINCINLDAHTDYRPAEGRHSGNGFRYAEDDGFLQKYCAIAVHENYLPQNVWIDIVNNPLLTSSRTKTFSYTKNETSGRRCRMPLNLLPTIFAASNWIWIRYKMYSVAPVRQRVFSPCRHGNISTSVQHIQRLATCISVKVPQGFPPEHKVS
jgi:hypothetical protein